MIPEKLNTITSYGQFLFPSSGPHESISEYDILKYEMFMKENDESVKSSDSDNEIDPHHIYSDNPLYTGKRKIPKILNIAKELPKFESTPQPTEKQALLTKINTKLVDLPINNTYNSDMKPKCFNTKPPISGYMGGLCWTYVHIPPKTQTLLELKILSKIQFN